MGDLDPLRFSAGGGPKCNFCFPRRYLNSDSWTVGVAQGKKQAKNVPCSTWVVGKDLGPDAYPQDYFYFSCFTGSAKTESQSYYRIFVFFKKKKNYNTNLNSSVVSYIFWACVRILGRETLVAIKSQQSKKLINIACNVIILKQFVPVIRDSWLDIPIKKRTDRKNISEPYFGIKSRMCRIFIFLRWSNWNNWHFSYGSSLYFL